MNIIGYLGADPRAEVPQQRPAIRQTSVSLAITERWTDKAGPAQEHAEWHRVVAGHLGEVSAKDLKKGSLVNVEVPSTPGSSRTGVAVSYTRLRAHETGR